jgi:8-oxo-dGTP pyrophosphatase MutT (NUDIX family)
MRTPVPFRLETAMVALREALPDPEDGNFPPFPGDGQRRQAAVSLILRQGREVETLLIRRAEAKGDPWSGHMALPGGRRDPTDPDLLHTARREALEETGVALERTGVVLGFLDPLNPATHRLPPLSIYPFVFAVPSETEATLCSREVAEVMWVPISGLFSPAAESTVQIPLGDTTGDFPCLRLDGRVIWGLTYRVLQDFRRRLEAHTPGLLPQPSLFPPSQ